LVKIRRNLRETLRFNFFLVPINFERDCFYIIGCASSFDGVL